MPIQYKDSIMDATKHCRENGSLFDVSHMCGLTLKVLFPGHWGLAPCMPPQLLSILPCKPCRCMQLTRVVFGPMSKHSWCLYIHAGPAT